MSLRTQILWFFFAFGLTPLLLAVVINLPLVLERTEQFYHKAHLLNLRADFRDLDQHLASREELLKVLSKAPEPGIIYSLTNLLPFQLTVVRQQYRDWINQIFPDQLDIIQIAFFNSQGQLIHALARDKNTLQWTIIPHLPYQTKDAFIQQGIQLEKNNVLISPLHIQKILGKRDKRQLLNIRLITSLRETSQTDSRGAVMFDVDISGIAQHYQSTLWVYGDGNYVNKLNQPTATSSAFEDYAGLESLFQLGRLTLWEGKGKQIIWIPLFQAKDQQTLWAGRYVDPSPMQTFKRELSLRVLLIISILVIFLALAANWVAKHVDLFKRTLMHGVRDILQGRKAVQFRWKGSRELETLADDLSHLAHQHMKTTQELRIHAQELEQAYQYKSEFLANMSHELRTPLNSIILLSKLIKQDALSSEQQQQASVIHAAGHDLKDLIDSVLDFSKIEAGHTQVEKNWVNLSHLLLSLHQLILPQCQEKQLQFDLNIAPNMATDCYTDEKKLRQIIKNFLSNAVKFTHSGKITLSLQPSTKTPSFSISVQDTGIGIPSHQHQHIFEAFQQADGSTTRTYGGTGLGLHISQRLAQLIGGQIQLTSQTNEGANFTLYLDSSDMPPPWIKTPNAPPVLPTSSEKCITLSGHLLIITQDIQQLLHASQAIEAWGLQVHGAADHEEAMETLEDTHIDIILFYPQTAASVICHQLQGYQTQFAPTLMIDPMDITLDTPCSDIHRLQSPTLSDLQQAIASYLPKVTP